MLFTKRIGDVKNLMVTDNTICINGVIGSDWWEESNSYSEFARNFKALEKKYDKIKIEINSVGGSMIDGNPMITLIQSSKKEVEIYNIGLAASMAAVISISGTKSYAYENSLFMFHSPSGVVWGNAKDMRDSAVTLDKFEGTIIPIIANKTGKTKDEVKALFFDYEDHFLTADEALELGIIDEIISGNADLPSDILDMSYDKIMAAYEEAVKHTPKQPIKNFFKNIIDNKMKIDQTILDALSLQANSTVQNVIDAITALKDNTELTNAQNALKIEQDAHQLVKDALIIEKQNVTDITAKLDTATAQLTQITDVLDAVDESIAKASTIEDKITAFNLFSDENPTKQHNAGDAGSKGDEPDYVTAANKFLGY